MKSEEGTIRLENGFNIWYRRLGEGGGAPLLVLHGGPGAGHDYLEPLGYVLDFAADGVLGLHLAVSEPFDVIVLDVMLPGMDGMTLCRMFNHSLG